GPDQRDDLGEDGHPGRDVLERLSVQPRAGDPAGEPRDQLAAQARLLLRGALRDHLAAKARRLLRSGSPSARATDSVLPVASEAAKRTSSGGSWQRRSARSCASTVVPAARARAATTC